MNTAECPYCGNAHDMSDFNPSDGESYEVECECGKSFMADAEIEVTFRARKADCLNGEPHKFSDWRLVYSQELTGGFVVRACKDCGKQEAKWQEVSEVSE